MKYCIKAKCVCAAERNTLSSRQKKTTAENDKLHRRRRRRRCLQPTKKKTTTCDFYRLHQNRQELTEFNGQSLIIIDMPATLNQTSSSLSTSTSSTSSSSSSGKPAFIKMLVRLSLRLNPKKII